MLPAAGARAQAAPISPDLSWISCVLATHRHSDPDLQDRCRVRPCRTDGRAPASEPIRLCRAEERDDDRHRADRIAVDGVVTARQRREWRHSWHMAVRIEDPSGAWRTKPAPIATVFRA